MTDAAALPPQPLDIAIVGMAGAYAGAADLRHYWQNILDKIDSVTDAPPGWSHDNYDPASTANDRIYTRRGGFLGKTVVVDPLAFGVLPSVAAGGDPDHLIALTYARDALVDAGLYDATKRSVTGVDPARAGVVLGRGTYGNRGMSSMIARGLFVDQMMAVARGLRPDLTAVELAELREHFVRQLPPYGPDMVGPLTPNVVAGMIANRLNLMGPSFIVDAACASTLIAVDAAVRELVSGRCDLMITGGVQSQTPAQLYIQFCQIKALSHGQLRPFQKGADGTLLGEGVGLLVLKRRADAERDGDRIYALIQGIGTSSDGRAKGFLAPRVEGQVLALRRAYASCGIAPDTLGYIEAHGTGTVVGDRCEIETLRRVFGDRGEPRIALGSVKSMIGHCLPAAASASMIKTALALHHKILPPMLCDEPDPSLDLAHSPFYINNETRPWIHGAETPRRAGVNAFGFGGANAHVVLEEYRLPRKHYVRVLQRPRPSELLALAADTPSGLQQLVGHALAHLRAGASLTQVACASAAHSTGALRLALVADAAQDAIKKLQQALDKFGRDGVTTAFKTRGGVYYGCGPAPGKLCFLYPGEGAQYPGMLADLCLQFPPVRAWFDFLERTGLKDGKAPRANLLFPPPTRLTNADRQRLEGRLYDMDVAAESVYCATLGVQALLDELGLEPDAMLGHSTGENTALTAAGVYRPRDADELAQVVQHLNGLYRQLAETGRIVDGELLTVGGLSAERRGQLLSLYSAEAQGEASNGIVVAMDNCPNQIVLFGPSEAVETLHETLSVEGAICAALPFGRAYHTQHFTPMAEAVQAYFETLDFGPGRCAVYSACHAGVFPQHPTAIRGLAAAQWNHPVRFTETIQKLYADGFRVFLELGPSANLTAFVTDTLREHKEVIAVSCDNRRRGGIAQLQRSLAQLFAAGVHLDVAALYAHRSVPPLELTATPAQPARPPITVTLEMPELSLPKDWAPLRRRPTTPSPAPAAPPPQRTPDKPAGVSPADARTALLRSHFALMDEFLASQSRVLTQLSGARASGARAGVAPGAGFPLLGTLGAHDATHLKARCHLDLQQDAFLLDHAIGGRPSVNRPQAHALAVVPFTFSMEIAAEAAVALGGGDTKLVGLDEVRGSRWLALDEDRLTLDVQATALPAAPDGMRRTQVRLYEVSDSTQAASATPAFEAIVLTAKAWPTAPAARDWTSTDERAPQANPDGELYRHGMFHGPRLQGVQRITRWGERSLDAELVTLPATGYFGFTRTPRFQLDAALLDAAGSLVAYWVAEREDWASNCFPFHIAGFRQYCAPQPAGRHLLGRLDARDEAGVVSADLDVIDPTAHSLLMRVEGWQDRKFAVQARFQRFRLDPVNEFLSTPHSTGDGVHLARVEAFPASFLDGGGGIWLRVLAHMVLHEQELAAFHALPSRGSRREEWLMGRIAAKDAVRAWVRAHHQRALADADIVILQDALRRPTAQVPGLAVAPVVSISHSDRWGFGAAAGPAAGLGVDYQRPRPINAEALATGALTPEEHRWINGLSGVALTARLAALWCAKEAAAKAAGTGLEGRPRDWRVIDWNVSGEAAQARVVHRQQAFNVKLMQTADGECVAWCQHYAVQTQPTPTIA